MSSPEVILCQPVRTNKSMDSNKNNTNCLQKSVILQGPILASLLDDVMNLKLRQSYGILYGHTVQKSSSTITDLQEQIHHTTTSINITDYLYTGKYRPFTIGYKSDVNADPETIQGLDGSSILGICIIRTTEIPHHQPSLLDIQTLRMLSEQTCDFPIVLVLSIPGQENAPNWVIGLQFTAYCLNFDDSGQNGVFLPLPVLIPSINSSSASTNSAASASASASSSSAGVASAASTGHSVLQDYSYTSPDNTFMRPLLMSAMVQNLEADLTAFTLVEHIKVDISQDFPFFM